ncbi:heterokaryon incompatibility protein-domain-containing protein [Podospora didyma]|uniref:Heterokaryon incompatibility protein-domain-containing protein n=1 Tax=Podospora didyma TaxID=330526 RepID=A0AAE0N279_9PEZI|nr:heterokaryon incompatibility protein-domain-containing protein [Podospora didyma]
MNTPELKRYAYTPLGGDQIRLLHILSISPEIQFDVEVVSLDASPSKLNYTAMSYLWGDATPVKRIIIDGQQYVDIAENLAICLSHLEGYVGERIWIDALCINQVNDEEKSRQVANMTAVYAQAAKVLVWLGPAAGDSDNAMEGVVRYGGLAVEAGLLKLGREYLSRWPEVGDDPERMTTRDKMMELMVMARDSQGDEERREERFPRLAFAALTQRQYFNRVWVKQEITLARKAVVTCGRRSCSAEEFHAATLFYGMLATWETLEWRAGRHERVPGSFSLEELMAAPGGPWDLMRLEVANPAVGAFFAARRKHQMSEEMQPLHELLHTSYVRSGVVGLQCGDPRDKIFGLLGIVSDGQDLGVVPDYSKTADEVYEMVARALITKQGRIDILKWCRSRRMDAPTWVPDFRADIAYTWTDEVGVPLFKATSTLKQPEDILSQGPADDMSIRLRGLCLDVVKSVGTPFAHDGDQALDQKAARKTFEEIDTFMESSIYPREQWIDAIWRIPICDREMHPTSSYFERATERSKEQFVTLLSGDTLRISETTMSYQTSMQYRDGARPILSEKGYVGLASSETEAGDVICCLYGGSTPFVLRAVENGIHLLVGEAYVYGIMDGEALELNLPEVTFVLR